MRGFISPLTKLSIFAVVTIALTALLATTIAAVGFGSRTTYRAEFTDVTGLLKGDDVRIAGVKVGSVEKIRIVRRKIAEVTFSVATEQHLSTHTLVAIRYRNLVGQRYLSVSEGAGPDVRLAGNAIIPLAQTEPALDLTVLFNGFKPLFQALSPKDVNSFALAVIKTLQGEGGTVNTLLARTADLTNTLADRDKVIGNVITNLNNVLGTVNQRDTELSNLIVALQRFVSGLAADRTVIGASLDAISNLTDSTAGLVTDTRPSIKNDINSLYTVSKTLNDSQAIVEGVLQRLPGKLTAITKTATYGSWLNFYLCDLAVVGLPVPITGPNPDTGRCAA
ncbi:MAG: MCE family protein [Pseudonocardiales bacterium]|nr:MAG: MCE family protein [Pseudonocardiales bacterium]